MFRAGSRSVIQVILRPQNGPNKLKLASMFNANNKTVSRGMYCKTRRLNLILLNIFVSKLFYLLNKTINRTIL
jgi:hypothetical protein